MNIPKIVPYSNKKHYAIVIPWLIDLQEIERTYTDTRRPGAEMAEEYFAGVYKDAQNHCGAIRVAEIEGIPVGFIACWCVRTEDVILTPQANHYGYISDVYVVKDYRGKGVFQELLKEAIDHLTMMGETSLRINVVADNEQALKAYLKAGFKKQEIILHMPLK